MDGLAFENDASITHETHTEPLTKLFHQFKDTLKCVVLNACYSEVQAEDISQQIDYVIGMSRGIEDESATKYAIAFYDAVFAETTFHQAFNLACTAINLSNLPDHDVPVFLTAPEMGGTKLAYTALIPQFEDLLLVFFNSPYEDRYKYTTKGESIQEMMLRYYGEQLHTIIDKVAVLSTRQVDDEHCRIRSVLYVKGEKVATDHYISVKGRSIKIEWSASVGYWSVPPKTYLALGTSKAIVARVKASLGTWFYGEFSDKRRLYQSVDFATKDSQIFHGYVRRHTSDGKELIKLLSDGNKHEVTLSIGNENDETEHHRMVCLVFWWQSLFHVVGA